MHRPNGAGRIYIVVGDRSVGSEVAGRLGDLGRVQVAGGYDEALELIEREPPDLVLSSYNVEEPLAEAFLARARALAPQASLVVMMAPDADPASVDAAIRGGADHCLVRPVRPDVVQLLLERALTKSVVARRGVEALESVAEQYQLGQFERIVGAHPAMQRMLQRVLQAAKTKATVLIHGETGTGKELIATAIHQHSKRRHGPFIKLNCSALAESVLESELFGHEKGAFTGATQRRLGRFEQAQGGTLFLDEVSEISPPVQVKLLRFLQERELERVGGNETVRVDARIVAATNRDLSVLVEEGRFREDLYYRLNVVRLDVPPLRARPSDIPLLAAHFLRHHAAEHEKEVRGFTRAALDALLAHPWPGNVRGLQNAVEQAVVLCESEVVDVSDLPFAAAPQQIEPIRLMVPGITLAELERYAILKTLEAVGGSTSKAASILGISRRTIQYRLKEWGLTRPGHEESA